MKHLLRSVPGGDPVFWCGRSRFAQPPLWKAPEPGTHDIASCDCISCLEKLADYHRLGAVTATARILEVLA